MMQAVTTSKNADPLFSSAVGGVLDDRLDAIRLQLSAIKNGRRWTKQEAELLVELLEGWACKESWEPVTEWASRAVLVGFPLRYASVVYRFWLEALLRHHEQAAAFSLCRHLLSFRNESREFLALALLGLSKLGRKSLALPVARALAKMDKRSVLMAEALATCQVEFGSRKKALACLDVLERVCTQNSHHYFGFLNCFESALDLNSHDHAARAINGLSKNYPHSPEPLRTAAQLAMDAGDWPTVVRCFEELLVINPGDVEARVALAGALEHAGELFGARSVLKACKTRVTLGDYDFSATLGNVAYKLFRKYGNPSHRIEAIRAFRNCARIAPRYGIPSATFHAFLHEMRAGVGELSVPSEPLGRREGSADGHGQRFWLCMANDYGWKRLLLQQSFLIKVPSEARKGDIVFLCRGQGFEGLASCKVEGILEILTPQVPDEQLERLVKCGNLKMFDQPVKHVFDHPPLLCHDGHGLHNFSSVVGLYYAEFSPEAADEVVAKVESLGQGYFEKRSKKYA